MSKNLAHSIKGAAFMMSLQLVTRVVTFSCNLLLNRISDVRMMGMLQDLDLLHSSLLFLSRETIRMAVLRNSTSKDVLQLQMNFSYVTFAIFGILGFGMAYLNQDVHSRLYILAAGMELLSEPFYIYCQSKLLYHIRVKAEGMAFLVQSIFNVCACVYLSKDGLDVHLGLVVHALGQIVYSTMLIAGYVSRIRNELPKNGYQALMFRTVLVKDKQIWIDPYHLQIAGGFVFQTIIKHLLTVGDKIAMVALGVTNENKGAYRLVSDLGSLVARILFQPLEEASRAYFSKSLTNVSDSVQKHTESKSLLVLIMQLQILFGSYFVFFAPNYTQLLLTVLYRKGTAEAASLLSLYCIYVPFMGINGVTEAFFQAVAPTEKLTSQTLYMIILWAVYILSSYWLDALSFGASGIVYANMINMALRIGFSLQFIASFFRSHIKDLIAEFIPGSLILWITTMCCFLITRYSQQLSLFSHVAVGLTCFLAHLLVLFRTERRRLFENVIKHTKMTKTA
jgi:oligosaccharide translocation protein RFT1